MQSRKRRTTTKSGGSGRSTKKEASTHGKNLSATPAASLDAIRESFRLDGNPPDGNLARYRKLLAASTARLDALNKKLPLETIKFERDRIRARMTAELRNHANLEDAIRAKTTV